MFNRLRSINHLREKHRKKQSSVGSWIQTGSSNVAEIMATADYDWLVIDTEHGSISVSDLPDMIRAIELHDCLPIVRILEGTKFFCKNALDAGAAGILIPDVRSAAQLNQIKSWCLWPPEGQRGVGFSRANIFGKYFESYKKDAQKIFIAAQIEHIDAINNLNEILNVKGLDAIIIGPYDLSASMGITGQLEHKDYLRVISEYEGKIAKSNIPFGIHIVQPEKKELQKYIKKGYLFIGYGTDALFLMHSSDYKEI